MPSTNLHQMKAALWQQAFLGGTQGSCSIGRVMAIRRRKGHLLALVRGWRRWFPVECVRIEQAGPHLLMETRHIAAHLDNVSRSIVGVLFSKGAHPMKKSHQLLSETGESLDSYAVRSGILVSVTELETLVEAYRVFVVNMTL